MNLPPNPILLWNGVERPALATSSSSIDETSQVNLIGQDMALSGLARVTVSDPETGATLAESFIAIGYNLVPKGLVYDSARSRFYVVTPSNLADPRFPPNSVVAFNPDTGVLGPTYTATNFLGQAALSDDGSALYVVGEGDGMVRRLDPQTLTLESTFSFRGPGGHRPLPDSATSAQSL